MTSFLAIIVGTAILMSVLFGSEPRAVPVVDAPAAQQVTPKNSTRAAYGEMVAYQLLFYSQAAIRAAKTRASCDNAVCNLSLSDSDVQAALNDIFSDLDEFSGEDGFASSTSLVGGNWYVVSWAIGNRELQAAIRTNIMNMNVSNSMIGTVQEDGTIELMNGSSFGGTAPAGVTEGTTVRIGFK